MAPGWGGAGQSREFDTRGFQTVMEAFIYVGQDVNHIADWLVQDFPLSFKKNANKVLSWRGWTLLELTDHSVLTWGGPIIVMDTPPLKCFVGFVDFLIM